MIDSFQSIDKPHEDLPQKKNSISRSTLVLHSRNLDECEFCPKRSYCITSETRSADFHPHKTSEGLFFQCLCKEGYSGNGWECRDINECLEDPWPCPTKAEGGYCVDTEPDDAAFPRYKCGCQPGYISFSSDEHGATSCTPEGGSNSPSIQPSSSLLPTLTKFPTPSPSMTGGCNLCPKNSLCIETSADAPDSFLSTEDDGKYIRCKCREGYSGDGFRCNDIDECTLDDPPCPSKEEGGFCVDRDPDELQFPQYECGCLEGFEMNSSNEHGATRCSVIPNGKPKSPSYSKPTSKFQQPEPPAYCNSSSNT
eukprot:CAMPEP_0178917678 /NCGR_PEP_ID=MMETSP0786-20121207/13385_1 /TAXON_ID=186022 /ORGANISM="Thalassionema frauenfeldii, Strain CCMP 1798" /LENGTH=309 /DNA_ID=CAMNT_0020591265 /DNA_START=232 /DNA_END=1157 /DNA_ORIENTATION=+